VDISNIFFGKKLEKKNLEKKKLEKKIGQKIRK